MITRATERLGINLVESIVLRHGLLFREKSIEDCGVDAEIEFVGADGQGNGRVIGLQIKSGPSYFREDNEESYIFRPSERHRRYWIEHSLPIIVVLCDIEKNEAFWEVVSEKTCIGTKRGWRLDVPKANKLNDCDPLLYFSEFFAPASEFSIIETNDYKTEIARIMSFRVIAHASPKGITRAHLSSIIRTCVDTGKKALCERDSLYNRWDFVRPTDIVLGFLYLRECDVRSGQWICRFEWISELRAPSARYSWVEAKPDINGLAIEWKLDRPLAKLLDERRISKRSYIAKIDEKLDAISKFVAILKRNRMAQLGALNLNDVLDAVGEIERSWGDGWTAPIECFAIDDKIYEVLIKLGNLKFERMRNPQMESRVSETDFVSKVVKVCETVIREIVELRRSLV